MDTKKEPCVGSWQGRRVREDGVDKNRSERDWFLSVLSKALYRVRPLIQAV